MKIAPAKNQAVYFKTSIQGDAVLHDHFDITTSRYSLQKLLLVCSGSCLLRMGPRPPGSGCSSHRHKQASNSNCQRHFTKSFTSSSRLSVLILQPASPDRLLPLSQQSEDTDKIFDTGLCALRMQASSCVLVSMEKVISAPALLFVSKRHRL